MITVLDLSWHVITRRWEKKSDLNQTNIFWSYYLLDWNLFYLSFYIQFVCTTEKPQGKYFDETTVATTFSFLEINSIVSKLKWYSDNLRKGPYQRLKLCKSQPNMFTLGLICLAISKHLFEINFDVSFYS